MTKKAHTPPATPEVEKPEVETPEVETPEVETPEAEDADRPRTIVFDRSHPGYAYWPGNTAVLGKEHTDLLVNGGFAHFADAETADAPTDEQR